MTPRRPEERLRQQTLPSTTATPAVTPAVGLPCTSMPRLSGQPRAQPDSRDYKAERERLAQNTSARMVFLRERREERWPAGFALIAQSIILAALPLRRTDALKVTREARLGDGTLLTVTFGAMGKGVPLPFGADVTLLYFLLDRAISAQSPIVEWRHAAEYLRFLGVDTDAGKNFIDLRNRWRRILGLAVHVERRAREGYDEGLGMFLIEQYRLPSSITLKDQRKQLSIPGMEYGLKLHEIFWRDAMQHHVPVPKDLIRETRDDLFLQRLAIFLGWRCYAAARAPAQSGPGGSVIPWEDVRQLTGSNDSNPWRIKADVTRALKGLHVLWPELQAEASAPGLRIARPHGNMHLLPDGEAFRRP
jgi:hypothetical protein